MKTKWDTHNIDEFNEYYIVEGEYARDFICVISPGKDPIKRLLEFIKDNKPEMYKEMQELDKYWSKNGGRSDRIVKQPSSYKSKFDGNIGGLNFLFYEIKLTK